MQRSSGARKRGIFKDLIDLGRRLDLKKLGKDL